MLHLEPLERDKRGRYRGDGMKSTLKSSSQVKSDGRKKCFKTVFG